MDVFFEPNLICGWARWPAGGVPLEVVAYFQGKEFGRAMANGPRGDLAAQNLGDCAFKLSLSQTCSAADLTAGRLTVRPVGPNGLLAPLPLGEALRPEQEVQPPPALSALLPLLENLTPESLRKLRQDTTLSPQLARLLDVLGTALSAPLALPGLEDSAHPPEQRISWLPMPVGLVSGDGSTVVGREGWLFLVDGPNAVRSLFPPLASPEQAAPLVAKWAELCTTRQAGCVAQGIGFAQLVIPEKLSALERYLPQPLETPSCLLAGLLPLLTARLGQAHVPALPLLRAVPGLGVFRKLDSHLSPYGTWLLAEAVAVALGLVPLPAPEFRMRGRLEGGDLTQRFFGVDMHEPLAEADASLLAQPELVEDQPPGPGEHQGWRRVWRNPAAPRAETLLVFGNSFSVSDNQAGLCWWLAQHFAEVRFLWSAALDWAEVARVRPAYVLCQTVERYLAHPPGG